MTTLGPSSLGRRTACVLPALCLVLTGAQERPAVAGSDAPAIPQPIVGEWQSDCRVTGLPGVLAISTHQIAVVIPAGQVVCTPAGQRRQTEIRWYLDFVCDQSWPLDLDINVLGTDRLLINTRPFGEACIFERKRG